MHQLVNPPLVYDLEFKQIFSSFQYLPDRKEKAPDRMSDAPRIMPPIFTI